MKGCARNILGLLWVASLALGLGACSTDVNVNAPYVERPIVYALADPADTVHFVRVQRSFLTDNATPATAGAAAKDSNYYAPGTLQVTLQPLNRTTQQPAGALISLSETKDTTKEAGIFYGPDQILFKTRRLLLNSTLAYRLSVTNTRTQKRVNAVTTLVSAVGLVNMRQPKPQAGGQLVWASVGPFLQIATLARADFATRFKVDIELPIEETLQDGTVRPVKTITWNFVPDRPASTYITYGGDSAFYSVRDYTAELSKRNAMFTLLKTNIDTTDTQVKQRRLLPLKISITRANQSLADYLDAIRSYSVLTQTRPFYSNIDGGIGVYGSRNIAVFSARIDNFFVVEARAKYPSLKF